MIELAWGILNIVLFLSLFVFSARKASEIHKKVSLTAAILFSFFALSFITRPSSKQKEKEFKFENSATKKQFSNRDTNFSHVIIEDDICTKFQLNAVFDGENVRSAFFQREGLIIGTEWSTEYININKTEKKNTFAYQIGGNRSWKILGFEIYSEYKEFTGVNEFKPTL